MGRSSRHTQPQSSWEGGCGWCQTQLSICCPCSSGDIPALDLWSTTLDLTPLNWCLLGQVSKCQAAGRVHRRFCSAHLHTSTGLILEASWQASLAVLELSKAAKGQNDWKMVPLGHRKPPSAVGLYPEEMGNEEGGGLRFQRMSFHSFPYF